MKSVLTKILQIITGIFGILYYGDLLMSSFRGDFSFISLNENIVILLFLIFILGFVLSWKWVNIAGIIIMIWYLGVWINGDFIDRSGGGMDIVLAAPAIYLGALMLLQWYRNSGSPKPSPQQQWRFVLRVFVLNYGLYYIILIFEDIINFTFDLFRIPDIIFPILLCVFLTGFLLSWKHELYAGIVFVIWYVIVLFGTFMYPEFTHKGPFAFIGFVVLLQGLFYIFYHLKYKQGLVQNKH